MKFTYVKQLASLGLLTVASISVFGQRRAINSAEYALESKAPQDVIIAYEEIEKAKTHPKTANDPRMWLVRSKVYQQIFQFKGNPMIKPISHQAGLKSANSIIKFYNSDGKKRGSDKEEAQYALSNAFASAFNEAQGYTEDINKAEGEAKALYNDTMIGYFQSLLLMYERLDTSMTNQLKGQKIERDFFVERIAYHALNNSDELKREVLLSDLVKNENPIPFVVESISKMRLNKGDTSGAKEVIKTALEKSNYANDIFNLLVNYYLTIDRTEELMEEVDKQIAEQPTSRNYWIRGYLNEQQKNYDQATSDYRKAREMDEYNYDANWNLGVSLITYKTRDLMKGLSSLAGEEKTKREKALLALFEEARGYLQYASENPKYSKEELVNISKGIRRCCMELEDKSCAAEQRDKIRTLNGFSLYIGDKFTYRISGNAGDLQIGYQNKRNTNSTLYAKTDADYKKAGWTKNGYSWQKTFDYTEKSDMLSLAITINDGGFVKGEILVNDEVVAEKEVEGEGARLYLQF